MPIPTDPAISGTWTLEQDWSFDGAAGDPAPPPWRNGPGWAEPHPELGGYHWRDAVALDSKVYQNGAGALRFDIDYNPQYGVVETGYLLTYPDGSRNAAPSESYKATPTEEGIYLETRVKYPAGETMPDPVWFAWWFIDKKEDEPRNDIDAFEYLGVDALSDSFNTNTHGPTDGFEGYAGEEEGYGGRWVTPSEHISPTLSNPDDGNWHTYGVFWSTTEQRFYYDGQLFWTRPIEGKEIHQGPSDLRLTVEAQDNAWNHPDAGLLEDAYAEGEFDNAYVLVDYVKVYERSGGTGAEVVIEAGPAAETLMATDAQDRFVFDPVSDSTRAARDEIVGIGAEDIVDLTALGFDELIFSGNPGSGQLLVREIGEGKNWESTILTGGWAESDFDLRVRADDFNVEQVHISENATDGNDNGSGDTDPGNGDGDTPAEEVIEAGPAAETLMATDAQDRFVFDPVSDSTRAAQDVIVGIDSDDVVDLTALGFDQLTFSGKPGSGQLLVREIGEGKNWESTILTGGWADSDFDLRIRADDFDVGQVLI